MPGKFLGENYGVFLLRLLHLLDVGFRLLDFVKRFCLTRTRSRLGDVAGGTFLTCHKISAIAHVLSGRCPSQILELLGLHTRRGLPLMQTRLRLRGSWSSRRRGSFLWSGKVAYGVWLCCLVRRKVLV